MERNKLQIEGKDAVSRTWYAELPVQGLGCNIFAADLTHNGQRDLAIYVPGIGDRGAYGTALALILFDASGTPTPWYAVGKFTENTRGIEEIKTDAFSRTWVVHTKQVGHPAWDGISYITSLYRISQKGIISEPGENSGIKFPHIASASPQDTRLDGIVAQTNLTSLSSAENLSTNLEEIPTLKQNSKKANFLVSKTASNTPIYNGENMQANPTTVDSSSDSIILSNGAKLDIPDILTISKPDGNIKIIFRPDEEDFQSLSNYHIQPVGTNCYDLDECQPFLIHAMSSQP